MDTARSSSESYENEVNISSLQVKQTAEPNGHDANVKSKEASSSDQIEKMDIQSCVDSQTEIFGSIEALQKAISYFEETTKSNFIVLQKTRSFGNEDWKPAGSEKILWKSPNSEAVTPISFTGVPYVVVGRKSLQCHLGKNFAHSNKHEKSEKQVQDHVFQKHRRLIQHTKKMGCLAEIHILHIIRFPGFEITIDTERRRKNAAKNLKENILKSVDSLKTIHAYVAKFPKQSEHDFHPTSGEIANLREKVDVRIQEKIISLHRGGVRKVNEMRRHVKLYVSKELFRGSEAPEENRRRFYPTRKDMSNIMAKARLSTKNSCIDQVNLLSLVQEWQKEDKSIDIFCRPTTAINEDGKQQTFLFSYQTAWQKRLLCKYGNNVTLFDATYRTTRYALPLFFLCVRTNVCYVVVGTFVTQSENTESIVEALTMIKSWNKGWNPICFLTDFCLEEMNSIAKVFPESQNLLCDFHREKAWTEWVAKKDHKVRASRKDVLKMLREIANATSMENHNLALETLKKSNIWKSTPELRQWFSNKWLPEIKKWARVFRQGVLQVGIHTNNGLERQHETLKYSYLEGYKNCAISEMITVLHSSFFPSTYKKYVELNVRNSEYYRKYKEDIPSFLKNRPREIIVHIVNRMNTTLDVTNIECKNIENGIFSVDSETKRGKKYTVSLVGENPSCTCADWSNFLLPCKHMCSIFKYIDGWGWDRLNQHYTNNPLFIIDAECFDKIIKEEKNEEQINVPCQLPPNKDDDLQDLPPRRRRLRTHILRNCNQLVKKIVDACYLIEDEKDLLRVEGNLEKLVNEIVTLVPKEEALPVISPKKRTHESHSFEPLPKRMYGRPKHAASQRVGAKADSLREDVWDTVDEECLVEKSSTMVTSNTEVADDTWVTVHGIRLSYKDKHDLETNEWLDDNVINFCQHLISQKFPHVAGLVDTLLLQNLKVDKVSKNDNIIQIHHAGAHWLVSQANTIKVKLVDSMKTTTLSDSLKKQITHMYGDYFTGEYSTLDLECLSYQKQAGSNDCGLFAIANALSLANGLNVADLEFEQMKMRSHLIECLEKLSITMFPHSFRKKKLSKIYCKKFQLTTYCFCKLHKPKEQMVECTKCKMWYHFMCAGVTSDSHCIKTKRAKYICSTCE